MIRRQILLTKDLVGGIQQIAQKQNRSQSAVVRQLLSQGLGFEKSQKDISIPNDGFFNLGNFPFKNPRIDGFRETFSVGGKTAELEIVGGKVFKDYLRNKKLLADTKSRLKQIGERLEELSLNKTLVVRRAYVVPSLENPPGPRFLNLKPEEISEAVCKIFDFAIEHEYHLSKNSQIFAIIHPFADPPTLSLPVDPKADLPYGGYAAPLNKNSSRVEVFATWGNHEGVQSLVVDRYVVNTERKIILEKEIPQKTLMLCSTVGLSSKKVVVPTNRQFEQVLGDGEILEVSRVVRETTKKYGLRRVEFSYDGIDSLFFNESAPYSLAESDYGDQSVKGTIKIVSSAKDVSTLNRLQKNKAKKLILYLDKVIVEEKAYDVLNSLAGLPQKFTILYPGLSATAHPMRVLNDFGHTAIVVGNKVFKNNEEIYLKIKNGLVQIQTLTQKNAEDCLIHLYDAHFLGKELAGGKADNLSLLKIKGFNVPHGWVLTTKFFDEVIKTSPKKGLKIPEIRWRKIATAANLSNNKKYAVRSSATVEDQAKHAFAGQFKTILGVSPKNIKGEVLTVMNSAFAKNVKKYLALINYSSPVKMAVVIQEMVEAVKAGVVFSQNLQINNPDQIVIEAVRGLGEGVVSGKAKSQRVIFSRNKNQIILNSENRKAPVLARVEIDALVEMTVSVENLMGGPQDIEWAIDKEGGLWLLQTRPLG